MKTLYININNEQIQSNEELEVLNYDLDSDFFFFLGEKIAEGCKVKNENALITDFNTQDNEEDYQQIIAQWNKLKSILFSEKCKGEFDITLPNGYIHWLKFHPQYVSVYDRNFSQGEPAVITIDLEELYEDSIEDLQRKILRKLQRDDLYLKIDVIVYNDDAVTRKSPIARAIKEKYDSIGFKSYKKWISDISKTDTDRNDKEISARNETATNTEEIFIVASDTMENDETKWFSEFYTKDGKVLSGTYELINGGRCPFYFYDGNYYCINNCRLKKIALSECTGANIIDEENAFYEYLILRNNSGTFVINNDGEILIPSGVYDEIKYAYSDCVLAQIDGLWGVVSLENQVMIGFQYDGLTALFGRDKRFYSFENEEGLIGVINEEGDIVISPEYEEVDVLLGGDNSAWFKVTLNGISYGIIDEYENIVIPIKFDDVEIPYDNHNEKRASSLLPYFIVEYGCEKGLYNSEGEVIVPLDNYSSIDFDAFEYNYIFAYYREDDDCYEDRPPFVYEIPCDFCVYDKNGLKICKETPWEVCCNTQMYYLKNKNGRTVYSSYCDELYYNELFADDNCYIEENGAKIFIIGSEGKKLGEYPKRDGIGYFSNGMAVCFNKETRQYRIINLNGRTLKIIPKEEVTYLDRFRDGKLFFVKDNGDIGYYDTSLSRTITCKCKEVKELLDIMQEEILYIKTKRGNLGLLNYYTGKLLEYEGLERIDPLTGPWSKDCPLIKDYFMLRKNGKKTLIDKDGNIIIKKEFRLLTCIQSNK